MLREAPPAGTCPADDCRTMPDVFCRQCRRWYCRSHADHPSHDGMSTPAHVIPYHDRSRR